MVTCKICKSSGRQGQTFLVESFEEGLENAICSKCIQPERSKREDSITYLDDLNKTDAYQAVRELGEIERKSREMRCSELYGNIET